MNKPIYGWLLVAGIALLPVYVFGSGGVQPSHMILAAFCFVVLLKFGFRLSLWASSLVATGFYALLLESINTVLGGNPLALMNGVFFIYNFILVMGIYTFCRKYGVSFVSVGVVIACVLALATVGISGISLSDAGHGRATGSFNNPNQLGYFSVCALSLAYLVYRHGHVNYLVAFSIFGSAMFLSIASLSKAAMVANFLVAFIALKPDGVAGLISVKSKLLILTVWLLSVVFLMFAFLMLYLDGFFNEFVFVRRLLSMGQEEDSSLEARGYFAILQGDWFHLLFGLGYSRVEEILGHEVHSTLGSVLNNYGLVGFLFFSIVLMVWAVKLWRAYGFVGLCCLAGPAMMYGITHNGTRFTAFWVLFASSLAMADRVTSKRALVAEEFRLMARRGLI